MESIVFVKWVKSALRLLSNSSESRRRVSSCLGSVGLCLALGSVFAERLGFLVVVSVVVRSGGVVVWMWVK